MDEAERRAGQWSDALAAANLLAVDPAGLGGVSLHALAGPVRDRWLAHLRALLPPGTPLRRMPLHISDDRLLGGLDLAATLAAGRPVAQNGLLAQCDGGLLIVAMAERLSAGQAARLGAALDRGEVHGQREGLALRSDTRLGVVALDEGASDDERVPAALADRLAFRLDLVALSLRDAEELPPDAEAVAQARRRLPQIAFEAAIAEGLCAATLALGIAAPRAAWLAWRAACASAALRGGRRVEAEDAELAARLVLSPRATTLPAPPEPAAEATPPPEPAPPAPTEDDAAAPPPPPPPGPEDSAETERAPPDEALEDRLVEAALAAIPAGLLAALRLGAAAPAPQAGRAGAWAHAPRGGRPAGTRRGDPRGSARLALVDTLRAAAPWQTLRKRQRTGGPPRAIEVRVDDFHVQRRQQRNSTTTLFVVDASGSSALHRLAEAKGAVHLLLADCYVRRDSVAVIGFRGRGAELLLPPTRSLVRAKRSLAALPGGGGTPLATAIDAAIVLAHQVRRSGATPVLVFLTDGRANVARDGSGGRAQAEADALRAARQLRAAGLASLLIDTSPVPAEAARRLAHEMAAHYRALPRAGAQALSATVRALQDGPAAPSAGRG